MRSLHAGDVAISKLNEVEPPTEGDSDMQNLEDALEYITAVSPIDVRVHDAALHEMNI